MTVNVGTFDQIARLVGVALIAFALTVVGLR